MEEKLRMKTNNYFIIHGFCANPFKHWVPWLVSALNGHENLCFAPIFPTPFKQDYTSWSVILESYLKLGIINPDTTIITHSLGSIFTIKFLIENKVKIKKLITVAGFNNMVFTEDNSIFDTFYVEEEKLENLKNLVDTRICLYSDNDPYIPVVEAEKLADLIGAEKIKIEGAGHFTKKDGYTEFPKLKEIIEKK